MPHDYTFARITRADYPMIAAWLAEPHIAGWWGPPQHELDLIDEEIDGARVDMRIVQHKGTPFAFVQDYNAHAFDAPHYADQPPDARAMDMFLGDPAFLGQGHATGFMAKRAAQLHDTYGCVLVDPDPSNSIAVATYGRAGFRPLSIRTCEDGDPVQILRFQPPSSL